MRGRRTGRGTAASPRARPPDQQGFTLMETLIALVLLSLMLSILFSGLRLGAGSWDAAQRQVEDSTEWAIAARFVHRQLAMAMPVQVFDTQPGVPQLAFRGDADRVGFVSALPSHLGGGGLRWVTLYTGGTEEGRGLLLSHRLYHPDTFTGMDFEDSEATLLLPGVSRLVLRYYGQRRDDEAPVWLDTWSDDRLPLLIALELTTMDGGQTTLAVGLRQGMPPRIHPRFPGDIE
jgi:general secretion pathway protein J